MCTASPAFKRILLKLSGEALMGDDQFGINRATIERIVREVAEVTHLGVEVAVVIGGGNIFRGVAGGSVGMDRATADYTVSYTHLDVYKRQPEGPAADHRCSDRRAPRCPADRPGWSSP